MFPIIEYDLTIDFGNEAGGFIFEKGYVGNIGSIY